MYILSLYLYNLNEKLENCFFQALYIFGLFWSIINEKNYNAAC